MNERTLTSTASNTGRLLSLDALRGFDMFWIMGADSIFRALARLTDWPLANWLATQLEHVEWHGFVFYDMIFPLFLFIAGVATPYALGKQLERGVSKNKLMLKVIRRGLILVVLGVIYNNGLFQAEWAEMRYASVLGRIGLAYMLAGLIFLNTQLRGQIIWFAALLLGYWAAMMLIPVPGFGAGQLTVDGSLAAYIDRIVVPGTLYLEVHDPEGLVSTIPAIATALLGIFAGYLLKGEFPGITGKSKAAILAAAGLIGLIVGYLWGFVFPINKNLWTSSFVLVAGGWSLLLLALFYLVIDVWKKQRWVFFFVVIGLNSILIYMAGTFIDFGYTASALIGELFSPLPEHAQTMIWYILYVAVQWGFLYFLFRKRVFLKV